MSRTTSPTKTITALTLTSALLLAACSNNTTTPTPSAATSQQTTTTPTPSLTQQEISIQEVKDTFTAYIKAGDDADVAGYTPETVTSVLNYLTADGSSRLNLVSSMNTMAEQGISMTGDTVIGSVTATSYTPGKQTEQHNDLGAEVIITACTDPSGKTVYTNGEEVEVTGLNAGCTSMTWVNQQGEWLLDSSEVLAEEYH
ncbi:MAG: hypothetical protein Q4D96_10010 [Propionibacteriaceae bacterium]|nr:hypothetical protein [Propionibacteriaceae bacterium]